MWAVAVYMQGVPEGGGFGNRYLLSFAGVNV